MDRRAFLRAVAGATGGATAFALGGGVAHGQEATVGEGPFGPLATEPDENGLLLPAGFTSRVVAIAGEPVDGTDYLWPVWPDGGATFPDGEGGWYHVVNSEVFVPDGLGGVSAIHHAADGSIVDAYSICSGTTANCAGGPTPWGTWLTCEEKFDELGLVWECDPTGVEAAVPWPALGAWAHEAVAIDPVAEILYLTQDHPEGLVYRFTPTSYPDLSEGLLEAATLGADGIVTWTEVPDPTGVSAPTRTQVPGATVFPGNEGIWYHDGWVWFTSKGDNKVHGIEVATQQYRLLWPGTEPLTGVDNITVDAGSGDLFVAEDGGDMQVVMITAEGVVAPFCQIVAPGHEGSEVTGPCFSPDGTRLYFSSQRGPTTKTLRDIVGIDSDDLTGGISYEITGPFRGVEQLAQSTSTTTTTTSTTAAPEATEAPTTVPSPPTTLAAVAEAASVVDDDGDDDGSGAGVGIAVGAAAVVVAAAAAAVAVRRRRTTTEGDTSS